VVSLDLLVWEEGSFSRMVPVYVRSSRVRMRTYSPSAPVSESPPRRENLRVPLLLMPETMAPRVSTCAAIARRGFSPNVQRTAPLLVRVGWNPSFSR